ncbi:hypothetical protein BO71DRAFT_399596 [Aspergillus ellipticus CBS 707.79]|uniref:Uncharacterized protein n=1 Tax=Aspergillus ellipticus CBS 707.79 TaxID=1448320 RepID=A0A319D8I8_9EURO|nr:hypothetical protein BO71DRAFT_399596 [Aspergillus ellipticus CBS 707.79]
MPPLVDRDRDILTGMTSIRTKHKHLRSIRLSVRPVRSWREGNSSNQYNRRFPW